MIFKPLHRNFTFPFFSSILLAFIFYHAGDEASSLELIKQWVYFKDILYIFSVIFSVWQIIRWMTENKRASWISVMGVTLLAIFIQQIIGELLIDWTLDITNFFTIDIPFGLVTGLGVYNFYKSQLPEQKINPLKSERMILVPTPIGKLQFSELDLLLVYLDKHRTVIHIKNKAPQSAYVSLNSILNELDEADNFYRLNRKVFVNKIAISAYKTMNDSRLKVEVLGMYFIVSKNNAAEFKRWFESN